MLNALALCGCCKSRIEEEDLLMVIEIDAASHAKWRMRGIAVCNINPAQGGAIRIYLIDGTPLLSRHSPQCLVGAHGRTAEYLKFLLATTDPQIASNIVSRWHAISSKNAGTDANCSTLRTI